MALTHVKMRLAALAVQQRAAAEAAAKMAADAKGEERAAAEAYAAVPSPRKSPSPRTRRRWSNSARRWTPRETRSGKNPSGPSSPRNRRRRRRGSLPPAERAIARFGVRRRCSRASASGVGVCPRARAPASTPGTATKTPVGATKEERARVELVERVYGETGVRLGPDWRVTYRPKSDGSFHRFIFSPGGKKFLSGTALVNHVKDFKARAMAVEGEAVKSPEQMERERIEDEEFSKEEATARRELLKQVFDETGVMLGANWRVSMERSWSAAKRRMVGRMRFFAPGPENKKFSSKADVVDFVERQVRRGKSPTLGAQTTPRRLRRSRVHPEAQRRLGGGRVAKDAGDRRRRANARVARGGCRGGIVRSRVRRDWDHAQTRVRGSLGPREQREGVQALLLPRGETVQQPRGTHRRAQEAAREGTGGGRVRAEEPRGRDGSRADDAPAKAAPTKVSNAAGSPAPRRRGKDAPRFRAAADQTRAQVRAQEANQGSGRVQIVVVEPRRRHAGASAAGIRRAPTPKETRAEKAGGEGALAQVTARSRFEELGVELNKGWSVVIASRKTGASSGTTDKYYIAPSVPKDAPEGFTTRVKFRSEAEVVNYARQLFGVPSSKKRSRAAKSAPASAAAAKTTKPNKKAKSSAGTSAAARAEEDEEGEDEMEDDVVVRRRRFRRRFRV